MTHDVFISYPHQEKATADAACAKLEAEGIRCWIAPRDIAPSTDWAEAIVHAIDQCRVMVLIFSTHANLSKQVRREVQQAFEEEKPVVPFRIEDVKPERALRYYIGSVHWLDALTPPMEQHLQKLALSVGALVRTPATDDGASGAKEAERKQHHPSKAQREPAAQIAEAERKRKEAEAEVWRVVETEAEAAKRAGAQARERANEDQRTWERRRERAENRRRREAEVEQERKREAQWRAEGRIKVDAKIIHGAPDGWFKPGAGKTEWFKDYEDGPEMVVVPAGEFQMGSPESELERSSSEGPLHVVKIAHPFSVGRHAITRGQFAAFVNNTNYMMERGATVGTGKYNPNASWRNPGFRQDDDHPAVCINWTDACAYIAWLSKVTQQSYRLLSEAEWEYVARAGTTTPFWWGGSISPTNANYNGNDIYEGGGAEGEWRKSTVCVGEFEANPWGLYNVHGNVWEWCEDIWHYSYNGAPTDGSAWLQGGDAKERVLRGGSWDYVAKHLRSADRYRHPPDSRARHIGFRAARTISRWLQHLAIIASY